MSNYNLNDSRRRNLIPITILHPEQQYLFTNTQMGLIYDLLSCYLGETTEPEELELTQETIDIITVQSLTT